MVLFFYIDWQLDLANKKPTRKLEQRHGIGLILQKYVEQTIFWYNLVLVCFIQFDVQLRKKAKDNKKGNNFKDLNL